MSRESVFPRVGGTGWARVSLLFVVGLALAAGCKEKPQPPSSEIVMLEVERVPAHPEDPAWQKAPEHVGKLLLQDIVEPRQLKATTTEVRVRALEDGEKAAFRLQWNDPTRDDVPGPGRFLDACALQVPLEAGPSLPAPQMGEPGKPVEILFWNAGWQAISEGRPHTLQALYPNAWVDHYPYEAPPLKKNPAIQREMEALYLPSQALGNRRGGPRLVPVEQYVAEGPGTLSPAPGSNSQGMGMRTKGGWSVVLIRTLPKSRHVALAVWDGAQGESGGIKMRTGWIPLRQAGKPANPPP